MSNIPERLQEKFEAHSGELVIISTKIRRLVGVHEGREDFYWEGKKVNGDLEHCSCVMGFTPLKGYLPQEDYNRIDSIFKLNDPNYEDPKNRT